MRGRWLMVLGTYLTAAAVAFAADKNKKPDNKGDKKVDANLSAQLRQQFERWDKNKDLSLDREELAKAFRGPSAKPAPEPKKTDEDKPGLEKPEAKQDARYPELAYLNTLDEDNDGKISLGEFEKLGKLYEEQFKKIEEFREKVEKQERELARKMTDAQRRILQQQRDHDLREMQRHMREMQERMRRQGGRR